MGTPEMMELTILWIHYSNVLNQMLSIAPGAFHIRRTNTMPVK